MAVAKLLRKLHDATETFEPPKDATWWWPVNHGPGRRVICHNDFAPWNVVFRDGLPVGVIDWDLAAPGPVTADIAWALWFFVPLRGNDGYRPALAMSIDERARRIRLFSDAYDLGPDERVHILEDVLAKHDEVIAGVKHLAELGSKGYQRLREGGHQDMHRDREFLLANMTQLRSGLLTSPEMHAEDVIEFLDLCRANSIDVWLDGGWGVDALLGEHTRKHEDLDIVLQKNDVAHLQNLLEKRGYSEADWYDSFPWVFLWEDTRGHRIDFHVIELDASGDGLYGPPEESVKYPAESLTGTGAVGGHPVRCISAKWQVRFHSGYKLTDKDRQDIQALCDRFGIPFLKDIPEHGTRWQALRGEVQIKVAIDQGVDLKELRRLQRAGQVKLTQANELEQTWERHVSQHKKGFMIGHSRLGGPDVLADEKVHEMERIVGKDKRVDIAHVHAAYLNRCDYFLTEDTKAFIVDGRREELEALLGVKIRRTSEFLEELGLQGA